MRPRWAWLLLPVGVWLVAQTGPAPAEWWVLVVLLACTPLAVRLACWVLDVRTEDSDHEQ